MSLHNYANSDRPVEGMEVEEVPEVMEVEEVPEEMVIEEVVTAFGIVSALDKDICTESSQCDILPYVSSVGKYFVYQLTSTTHISIYMIYDYF